MKTKFSLVLLFSIIAFYVNAQNIGINTPNPTNTLSVNGTVDIAQKLGVGTATPAGELHVKSLPTSLSTLDQQNTELTATIGATAGWQSFTAAMAGFLTKIELKVISQSTSGDPGTIKIYDGEGTGGSLLSTINVTFMNTYAFQSFNIPNFVNVAVGNKYTIAFSCPSVYTSVETSANNLYSGGMSNFSAYDLLFKTYVANSLVDAFVVSDAKVGIGTSTPLAKLDVSGNIKITDGTEAEGKVLTSDANGLANWATPTGGLSAGTAIGNTPYWNGTTWITNSSNIYNNGGNVGIGTNSPADKLHIKTGNLVVDDGYQRFFVAGIPKWDLAGENNAYYISRSGIDYPFYISMASGNVGIGTTAPSAKLSVNGTANNSTGSWGVFSDARIKTVNSDFTDGLNVISKIHPVIFNYNTNAPFMAEGEQIGIVAQELEKIAPYMVSQKEYLKIKDLREVNNQAYVFLLINAVKELSSQNVQLKAELELIKTKLDLNIQANNR